MALHDNCLNRVTIQTLNPQDVCKISLTTKRVRTKKCVHEMFTEKLKQGSFIIQDNGII
uniref:Uncharacterized protein n=1 Tax=Anguilla anguilla TaxID=7936 RepID=A0A0E9VTU0_ANGAN